MTTQFEVIMEKYRRLEANIIDIEHLVKTLKNSFEISSMEALDCYYLESIINIIRHRTHAIKKKTAGLHDKLVKYEQNIFKN